MALPYDTDALIKQTQQMLAQTKAEGSKAFVGSSFDTMPTQPAPIPSISSTSLAPSKSLNFQSAQIPPTPVVQPNPRTAEDIINELYGAPAQNEAQVSDLQRSIAELTGQQATETMRRNELLASPELEAKRQQVRQLVNRANALAAEAQAIPMQIQQDAQTGGANVTKGGLAPMQTAALRNNAIQALSTGALLSAAQGDLTSALDQVDRAVAAEFEPIKAQLAAQRANLEMLMNDPASTREEKRRAALAEAQLKQIETEQATREDERRAILDMATKAASQGADGLTLKAISSAQSQEEVLAIMQHAGLFTPEPSKRDTQVVQLKDGRTVLLDTQTGEVIKSFVGGVAPSINGGATIVTKTGETVEISKEAKNWVDLINNGAISFDEALTKIGSTAASMELKNEIIAGINAQGGQTDTKIQQMQNTVSTIDDILGGDFEYFGASIAPRDGFLGKLIGGNPYYESFKSKVDNLVAGLTADNLSLLKGPMSDKDIEFIKALSSGITLKMSETEAKKRLEQIKKRLNEKIEKTSGATSSTGGVLRSPDGKQEVSISELTPEELQEAKDAGWK